MTLQFIWNIEDSGPTKFGQMMTLPWHGYVNYAGYDFIKKMFKQYISQELLKSEILKLVCM